MGCTILPLTRSGSELSKKTLQLLSPILDADIAEARAILRDEEEARERAAKAEAKQAEAVAKAQREASAAELEAARVAIAEESRAHSCKHNSERRKRGRNDGRQTGRGRALRRRA